MSAFQNLDRFEGRSGIGTWLHRITVNACLMKLRTRERKAEESIDDLLPEFDQDDCRVEADWSSRRSVDDILAQRQVQEIVLEKIRALPDSYRIVLMLRDIEELDTREVADLLDTDGAAARRRSGGSRQGDFGSPVRGLTACAAACRLNPVSSSGIIRPVTSLAGPASNGCGNDQPSRFGLRASYSAVRFSNACRAYLMRTTLCARERLRSGAGRPICTIPTN